MYVDLGLVAFVVVSVVIVGLGWAMASAFPRR